MMMIIILISEFFLKLLDKCQVLMTIPQHQLFFNYLYCMLSVYAVIKPPKTGNCTVSEGEKLNV